jgi:Cd2+/Zn2+-exporting ATPase
MSKPLAERSTTTFDIDGMDCASCVRKIESAVARIHGVSDVQVGLMQKAMTASLSDPSRKDEVVSLVRSLGYEIRPRGDRPAELQAGQDSDHADEEHGQPIEGHWWQSSKGVLVIVSGLVLALAYLESWLLPYGSRIAFLAAAAIGAFPVVRRALSALRHGQVFTIEMLMSIAVIGAVAIGATEEAALVVFLFAVGELLEGVAAGRARAGIKSLATLAPTTALLETSDGVKEVGIGQLQIGSTIVARPGDRIAADGVVVEGTSSVDEAALTGESVPVSRMVGDQVLAGSINAEAVLRIRVERTSGETLISRVGRLVEEAADAKAPSERFIDSFARWYMPLICALAIAVALAPPLLWNAPWDVWIYRALALLLIGCPCALVISTPATIASALAAGARRGLLVKGGGVLEAIGAVKHVAMDKTGTLTEGKPRVTDVVPVAEMADEELLRIAASAESSSSHPLATAIVASARARGITVTQTPSEAIPGRGLSAVVEGRRIVIGAVRRLGVTDAAVLARSDGLEADGKSVSVVLSDDVPLGLIALRDEPRSDAVQGIADLQKLGLAPIMLTGDNEANAKAVGKLLGMPVHAELLPEDKLKIVRELSLDGGVAKIGDGINDSPALAAATVGIAMGSGTDVALETADAAILNNRILDVGGLVRLSRRTVAVIRQNVAIALGLKAIFLVTTILGMTGLWIAILADTGATVMVTLNALQLLRFKSW